MLIAMILLVFGSQGASPTPTGAIEGKVVRASNSEPISGVQITLLPPVPPAPPANAPPPLPGQAQQASQSQPGLAIQLVQNADGTQTIQTTAGVRIGQIAPGTVLSPQQIEALAANVGATRPQITAVTDSDGKFAFQNLAPGTYTIRAQRAGYFGPMSPQGSYPGGVIQSVTVEENKTAKLEMGMVQGGVLRGLLRDPDGQPAANYAVVTARPGYTNLGRAIWLLTGAMNADDRGEYRWPNFAPGEYYVGAGPRAPGPIANIQDSWARVFSPGVIDPNQARPVTITEGAEVTVNLSAQVKPWGAFKISGVALNPLPVTADPVTGVVNRAVTALVLMPLDLTPLDNPPVTSWTNLVATNTKPNGEFVLSNVDPGRYELYAMANDAQNRRIWTGHMRVEVRDKDLTGLNITVSPGVTLQGEVTVTGPTTVRPEMVRVQLQALGTLPPPVATAVGAVSVDASGKFQIANLSEGRYRMNVQLAIPSAYVAAIQQGGVNVYDDGFEVNTQSAQLPIRIEINSAGETVEGNVRNSGLKEAPNAMVVLVPSSHRTNPGFYKTGVTDEKGHFVIRGVAPGPYTVFAWDQVLPFAFQNADFIAKHQGRGRPLNVQAGSQADLQLDLIQMN
jgi:protocatechuate 3,4-dioxygenase beta subunit